MIGQDVQASALAETGAKRGVARDWPALTNELRRRALKRMLNLGRNLLVRRITHP